MLFVRQSFIGVSSARSSGINSGIVYAILDLVGLRFDLLWLVSFSFSSESSLKSLAPGCQRVAFATDLSAIAQVSQVHELFFVDDGRKADLVAVPGADFDCAV